jgi:hypothetical protein
MVMGQVQKVTGSFTGALWFLGGMMGLSVVIVLLLFRTKPPAPEPKAEPGVVHA